MRSRPSPMAQGSRNCELGACIDRVGSLRRKQEGARRWCRLVKEDRIPIAMLLDLFGVVHRRWCCCCRCCARVVVWVFGKCRLLSASRCAVACCLVLLRRPWWDGFGEVDWNRRGKRETEVDEGNGNGKLLSSSKPTGPKLW